MAKVLLHGTLHVSIFEGRGIATPSEKKHHRIAKFFGSILESAQDAIMGDAEYYATVDLEGSRVGRTRVLKDHTGEPVWNESFRIYCCHMVSQLTISIKNAAVIGTVVVGRAKISADDLLSGQPVDDWYQLYRGEEEVDGQIRFRLQFYEASHDPHWGEGIADPRYKGVPYCYFPQRKGCKVTLYQDAHMEDGFLPEIYQAGGQLRQPTHCWEDVFTAINNARHLIYITGWSVYCEILLVRDPNRPVPESDGVTLGELLKKKAAEGVRVNLLVWDDRTSLEVFHKDGLMATHDQDTEAYFQGSQVNCHLCPRNPDDSLSMVQGFTIGNMFTHHQKTIIVDAPLPGANTPGRRRIMSFVGGIDLCDGRYDNQRHSLFRTLNDLNMNDFHQPNYPDTSTAKGGPREPWHDIHSRIEGPVAWDVLWNFEQRWQKQAKAELLLPIKDIDTIDPPSAVAEEDDPDTWTVQLFRSIDAGAAFGFPDDPETVARAGLTCGKDNTIDRSIQDAYVNAIRRAKNFIYIENQYFLGSCFGWKQDQDAGALHLIPMELTRKICSKIEDGERFAVYVVVPMWPEGIPESGSVQAILDWQHNTMEMMYTEVATAIRAAGVDAHPRDYLTFFCLANRETYQEGEFEPTEHPEKGSNYAAAQQHRRFMIYVHAKMLIADDEYTIIGSANINQRSLDGARDSEIAIGAYQPFHLCAQRPPRSHIHGFRMSLWYEHLGRLDNAFLQPWSVECMRKVNASGDRNWALWAGEEVVDMPGHLLSYPVQVDEDGTVSTLPGMQHFPDTQANILGTKSDSLPSILTT